MKTIKYLMTNIIHFKKTILLIIGFICITAQAQTSVHNYFSATINNYIQIGFNNGFILYRIASPQYNFSRLNFLGHKEGFNYYGTQSFQVAITLDAKKVYVFSNNSNVCYNYVGPVIVPSPNQNNSQNNTSSQITSSKCPFCNGTGRITKNDHVTQYGLNDYTVDVKCSECGTTYCKTYTNHYHLNCGKCGGTGIIRN